jgi:hypothetical protein
MGQRRYGDGTTQAQLFAINQARWYAKRMGISRISLLEWLKVGV